MNCSKWFIFLKKSEPKKMRRNCSWVMDESKCMTSQEVARLRRHATSVLRSGLRNRKFSPVRDWFMVEFGLNTGLRVQEMASLSHGSFLIDGSKSSIVVVGKGGKKRSVWISTELKRAYLEFLKQKTSFGFETYADSPALNNLEGDRISKRSLQKFFKRMLFNAGISTHYSIHCLRHTYTTFLLKACNYNFRFVQKQLGHSSIKTTQVYASVLETEGRKAIEKLYL